MKSDVQLFPCMHANLYTHARRDKLSLTLKVYYIAVRKQQAVYSNINMHVAMTCCLATLYSKQSASPSL